MGVFQNGDFHAQLALLYISFASAVDLAIVIFVAFLIIPLI